MPRLRKNVDVVVSEQSMFRWLRRLRADDYFVVLLLSWWATALTWGAGGNQPLVLSVTAALCIPAILCVRPWERLNRLTIGVATAVAVAPWIVVLTAPTGFNGADAAGSYVVGAITVIIIAGWANTTSRVWLAIGFLLAASFLEFARAFWPWLGSSDPNTPMVGTFYYLNSFGAFMIPGVILGITVVLRDIKPLRIAGLVIAPLSFAGVLYSTSKGSQISLAIGLLVIGVLGVVCFRWSGLIRLATVAVLSALVSFAVAGPPFFSVGVASAIPGTSTLKRVEGSEIWYNGLSARLDWMGDSFVVLANWPITGSGFHSLAVASHLVDRPIPSAFVHNSYLQALAEGGLVLGLPFVGGCLAIAFIGARWVFRSFRNPEHFLPAGISVALLAVMLHSFFDWDWNFPAAMMQAAILAGLVIPRIGDDVRPAKPWIKWAVLAILIVSLAATVIASWDGKLIWNFWED